ncbi:hypothetical protein PGTUg99_014206 [Puccinia graminis f. sp. tritici]|uniref:Gamma tubulin complex component C-terminal domain-containing protein n=1 Tax=Puccinia graminis f. sp. tritici TaxID=56615 RepID=A0A5B0PPH8_PUCGR|nr:hypothetical protein PGTUg99_014206 [Puccinia graminis f. sp. tritici]
MKEFRIPELRAFDHQLLSTQPLKPLKQHDYQLSIHLPPISTTSKQQQQEQQQEHDLWSDLYQELSESTGSTQKHLIYSWDTFNRPICSQSSLRYQTPYPLEESIQVWEAILSETHPNLSSPIDRTTFITHFFRRSIGFKTPTPTSDPHALKPRPEHNSYPRIYGQTDQTTRSLYELSDSAFANLCSIENFIKHTHHPYHPHQSLCSGLAVLVDWIRTEIMDCFEHESALQSGLLAISMMVEPLFDLLGALANLVQSCQEEQGTRQQEDVVYQHLDLHIHQCSSNLIQAVFSWLLDRVCAALLLCWQTWLGIDLGGQRTIWPDEKDQLYQSLWKIYGIQSDPRPPIDPHLELTGDDLDETGTRTASSYCFHPDRVSSFFPITLAESIFKAGVSLRILRRANPFHPICLSYPVEEHGQSRWVWTPQDLEKVHQAASAQRHDMKLQISAWRHGTKRSDDPSMTIRRAKQASSTRMQDIEQGLEIKDFLKVISAGLKPHDTQVGGSRHIDERQRGLIESLEERLRGCKIERSGLLQPMEIPSLDILTEVTVLESLRCRALEIDRCLLSFFLVDLEFLDHLKILNQFLFCNDMMFNERLTNALFSRGEGSSQRSSRRPVGVSERLLRRGSWPPGGFDLSFALRTVILDSVAPDQRPMGYRSSSAWETLEDRLSFAIRPGIEDSAGERAYRAETIDGFGFLMIDFKPPEALRSVLGADVLEQYRIINTYLMKLLRLQAMMKANWRLLRPRRQHDQLPSTRTSRDRRYIQAVDHLASHSQRLLDGLVSYTWEVAIGSTWAGFMGQVERVKAVIEGREALADSPSPCGGPEELQGSQMIESVEQLNRLHRLTLTEIMSRLFLRSKQEGYLNLLSRSIFETIIQLSIHLQDHYSSLPNHPIQEEEEEQEEQEEAQAQDKRRIEVVDRIETQQFTGTQKLLKALDLLHRRSVDLNLHSSALVDPAPGRKIGFLIQLISRLDFNSFFYKSDSLSSSLSS